MKASRADPATRAEGEQRFRALVDELHATGVQLAVPLFHKARERGTDPTLEPELEARLEWLEVASAAARLAGEPTAAAAAEQERAEALDRAGRPREACDVLRGALASLPGARAVHPHLWLELAELERQLGRTAEAEVALERLLALAGDDPALAPVRERAERVRDFVALDLGLPDEALPRIRARWKAAEAGDDPALRATARLDLLHGLRAVGDLEGVVELGDGFLAQASDPAARAQLLVLVGASETTLEGEEPGRLPTGAARLEQALALGLDAASRVFARTELAEAAWRAGDLGGALAEAARARAEADALDDRASGAGLDLVTLEARLALARGAGPAELTAQRGRVAEALATMRAAWEAAPEREGGVGWLLYARRRALVAAAIELAIALDGPLAGARAGLDEVLALEVLGTRARRAEAPPATVDAVRAELLEPHHGILVYLPARGGSHAFALDADRLTHVELAPSHAIEGARRRLLAQLLASAYLPPGSTARHDAVERERALAAELSRLLLEPLEDRLAGWQAVTIVGDSLGRVPFEWLPVGDEPFLGCAWSVDHLPALALGLAWARRPHGWTRAYDYLLVGEGPHASGGGAREPISLDEALVRRLQEPFASTRALVGESSGASALERVDLGGVAIAQFLLHGELDPRDGSVALALGGDGEGDGLLRPADVERLRAPRLVVLTACRTGQGPTRKGDPAMGDLAGAWLAAGAAAVVAAGAELRLDAAEQSSSAMLWPLSTGTSPAEALRAARQARVAALGLEAPFGDGLLQVHGLGQRAVLPSRPLAETERGDRGLLWLAGWPLLLVFWGVRWALSRRGRARPRSAGS